MYSIVQNLCRSLNDATRRSIFDKNRRIPRGWRGMNKLPHRHGLAVLCKVPAYETVKFTKTVYKDEGESEQGGAFSIDVRRQRHTESCVLKSVENPRNGPCGRPCNVLKDVLSRADFNILYTIVSAEFEMSSIHRP